MDDLRKREQDANMRTNATEDITTADGAVRELEKNDEVARVTGAGVGPDNPLDTDWNTVISLGKDGNGSPEEDAAEAEEAAGITQQPVVI